MNAGATNEGATAMNDVTYTVDVAPIGFGGVFPIYEVGIYKTVINGVSSPGPETVVYSLPAVDEWLNGLGFYRTGEYGKVCTNGFASAPIVKSEA